MTSAAIFNTLALTRKLKAAGFSAEQAEGLLTRSPTMS